MPTSARLLLSCVIGMLMFAQTACTMVPHQSLRQAQLRTLQLHRQNQSIAMQRNTAAAEKQQLAQRSADLQYTLNIANQRLDNLNAERKVLQEQVASLIDRAKSGQSPLSPNLTRRFEALAQKYPEFEFDPQTGVSKFHNDILFGSGSSEIRTAAIPILGEFADIMNQGDAQRLNILVVGHTDDRRIAKDKTRSKHSTNWHLSTNRATEVLLSLAKSGLQENRMSVAGYAMYQPVVHNDSEKSRKLNRRVEIFVLAPDAIVASWDPITSID